MEPRTAYLLRVCGFILLVEVLERQAYYGLSADLQIYLTSVLGLSTSEATSNTIILFSVFYLIGLSGLTLSAAIPSIAPAGGSASSGQLAFFWMSMYAIALGMGGIKPCVSSFGADQFYPEEVKERASFFNYFYAAVNVGSLAGTIGIVFVLESIGWGIGYAICAASFSMALLVFILGWRWYTKLPPSSSPLSRMSRTIYAAWLKRKHHFPPDGPHQLYELDGPDSAIPGCGKLAHSPGMRWLDKAAIKTDNEPLDAIEESQSAGSVRAETLPGWTNEITVTHVQEVKVVSSLLPILATNLVFQMIYNNIFTLFISQGSMMDRSMGSITIPAATISSIDTFAVLIGVVLYDVVLAPLMIRLGRPITILQRIGIGYCLAALAMVVAAGVEIRRLQLIQQQGIADNENAIVNMSWTYQIPQYTLVGFSEVFANIGAMQLFYEAAPESLRSLCSALYLLSMGISGFMSSALIEVIQSSTSKNGQPGWIADNLNQAHLDYFFWVLAGMQLADILVYVWVAKRYTRMRPPVDVMVEGGDGKMEPSDLVWRRSSVNLAGLSHGTLPGLPGEELAALHSRAQKASSAAVLGSRPYGIDDGSVVGDSARAGDVFLRQRSAVAPGTAMSRMCAPQPGPKDSAL